MAYSKVSKSVLDEIQQLHQSVNELTSKNEKLESIKWQSERRLESLMKQNDFLHSKIIELELELKKSKSVSPKQRQAAIENVEKSRLNLSLETTKQKLLDATDLNKQLRKKNAELSQSNKSIYEIFVNMANDALEDLNLNLPVIEFVERNLKKIDANKNPDALKDFLKYLMGSLDAKYENKRIVSKG